jgi:phosphopantothenoylcysteine decarboxylase/phosphopantothenate--cysteine ligase
VGEKEIRQIVLGVTGGIAAYKACELVRLFVRGGLAVHVIMTEHAREFISPLTFSTLSGNPVASAMFEGGAPETIQHIDLADDADLVVVCPATANVIAKVTAGICDDLLTTVICATRAKVLFAPAMNVNMYENPITRGNIERLESLGYHFVEPTVGWLACGWEGKGRLAEPDAIYDKAIRLLTEQDLAGLRLLVTAGPTREAIDPVRFISNRSSGRMGYALASRAAARGAAVTLVSGPSDLAAPGGVELVRVESAADMAREVKARFNGADAVIKAAAVADLTPKERSAHKVKKDELKEVLELSRTEDILKTLGGMKGNKILVGFAAETDDLVNNAKKKLAAKNLDLIVANDVSRTDSGFAVDTNAVRIIGADGEDHQLPLTTKEQVAEVVLDRVKELWKKTGK